MYGLKNITPDEEFVLNIASVGVNNEFFNKDIAFIVTKNEKDKDFINLDPTIQKRIIEYAPVSEPYE